MSFKIIAISLFFTLLLGAHVQSFAQASASVSYTIVVSEDMLAQNDRGFDYNGRSGSYRFQQNSINQDVKTVSSVSVTMHAGTEGESMKTIAAFEAEMSTEQTPAIKNALSRQVESNNYYDKQNVKEYYCDNDTYFVVMEYN